MNFRKVLVFFLYFKIQNTLPQRNTRDNPSNIFKFKQHQVILDLVIMFNIIYRCLKILHVVHSKNGTIMFVGNNLELKKLFYVFKSKTIAKASFFISNKWLSGLITNWAKILFFVNTIQASKPFLKKSKRLRFFRYFFVLQKKNKPDLVVVFNSTKKITLFKECQQENIPVMSISSLNQNYLSSFQIQANSNNVLIAWVFLQLFINPLK